MERTEVAVKPFSAKRDSAASRILFLMDRLGSGGVAEFMNVCLKHMFDVYLVKETVIESDEGVYLFCFDSKKGVVVETELA
jgi:hypothetical protein